MSCSEPPFDLKTRSGTGGGGGVHVGGGGEFTEGVVTVLSTIASYGGVIPLSKELELSSGLEHIARTASEYSTVDGELRSEISVSALSPFSNSTFRDHDVPRSCSNFGDFGRTIIGGGGGGPLKEELLS